MDAAATVRGARGTRRRLGLGAAEAHELLGKLVARVEALDVGGGVAHVGAAPRGARLLGVREALGHEQGARLVGPRASSCLVEALVGDLVASLEGIRVFLRARSLAELREDCGGLPLDVDALAELAGLAVEAGVTHLRAQLVEGRPRADPILGGGGPRRVGQGRLGRGRRRGRRGRGDRLGRRGGHDLRRRRGRVRPAEREGDDGHDGRHAHAGRDLDGEGPAAVPDVRIEDVVLERADEAQLDVAELDDVARVQLDALVVLAVDADAVGALQIDDRVAIAVAHDLGVVPRDRAVVDDDVVLVGAADHDRGARRARTPAPRARS